MATGILFDLDGTLLDTLEDLCDGVNYALSFHGYPQRMLEEVRRFVGNGAKELIRLATPSGEDWKAVFATFQPYYDTHCQIKTHPYPGIVEALGVLKEKYPIAIVSNKPDSAVKALCRDYFPGIYALGETPGFPRKPAADMVFKAMAALGVERCIYVGDSEVDVLTAENANVPCLCVTWGFRGKETLEAAGGEHFCEHPEDLIAKLDRLLRPVGL